MKGCLTAGPGAEGTSSDALADAKPERAPAKYGPLLDLAHPDVPESGGIAVVL